MTARTGCAGSGGLRGPPRSGAVFQPMGGSLPQLDEGAAEGRVRVRQAFEDDRGAACDVHRQQGEGAPGIPLRRENPRRAVNLRYLMKVDGKGRRRHQE